RTGGAGRTGHRAGRRRNLAHPDGDPGGTGGGMNGRAVIAVVGVLTVFLGVYGLVRPDGVLAWVGLDLLNTNRRAGLVEARAVYGGLFLVLGVFTLWAAISPRRHRGELLLIACLWLGRLARPRVRVSSAGRPARL